MIVWLFCSLALLFAFNNCGQFVEQPRETSMASSFASESYPWPNASTSLQSSNKIVSSVLFDDFDQNTIGDAVFVSLDSSGNQFVIRVVNSGSFIEQFNIVTLASPPDVSTTMLLKDLDDFNQTKELVYLNFDRTRVIAIDLANGINGRGHVRFDLPLVNPILPSQSIGFRVTPLAIGQGIEIGENMIVYGRHQTPMVVSGNQRIDGGWGPWADWHVFCNGLRCSKSCGDGVEVRNRICNRPAPRNGGSHCRLENVGSQSGVGAVQSKSCRVRTCNESDCAPNEFLRNGNCERGINPDGDNDTSSGGSGGGTTGGGSSSGGSSGGGSSGGGSTSTGNCSSGQVWEPEYLQCFRAYPVDNITLTDTAQVLDENAGNRGGAWIDIVRTLRISLNHPKVGNLSNRDIASLYCQYRGHVDVVSYTVGNYTAGTEEDRLAFVPCLININGMYNCSVQANNVSFSFKDILYDQDTNVEYLRSVICRKEQ